MEIEVKGAYRLKKLGAKTNAEMDSSGVYKGQVILGEVGSLDRETPDLSLAERFKKDKLVLGQCCTVTGGHFNEYIRTTELKSIYQHKGNSGFDKLVLPNHFGDVTKLEFPELKDGDFLLATRNSVYHLQKA